MKVSKYALLKAIDRTKLVPVEVPIRTKFGMTRGIRYKNPKTAINQTAKDIVSSRSDIKNVEDIEFKNKATGKVETLDQVAEAKQKSGGQQTMQQFVSQNYSIGKKGGCKKSENKTKTRDNMKVKEHYSRLYSKVADTITDIDHAYIYLENGDVENAKGSLGLAKEDKGYSEKELKDFEKVAGDKLTAKENKLLSMYSKLDSDIKNLEEAIARQEGGTDTTTSTGPNIDEISNDLTWVDYDSGNNTYTLEFNNGEYKATVDADEYAQAATDEGYFDDPDNIKTAIKQAMNEGTFEDARGNQVGGEKGVNKETGWSSNQSNQQEKWAQDYGDKAEQAANDLKESGEIDNTSMGDLVERLKSGSITLEQALSNPSLRMDAIILLKIIAEEEGIDLEELGLD